MFHKRGISSTTGARHEGSADLDWKGNSSDVVGRPRVTDGSDGSSSWRADMNPKKVIVTLAAATIAALTGISPGHAGYRLGLLSAHLGAARKLDLL